jgi:hypothetical protein
MDQHKAVPKNLLGGAEKKDKKHQWGEPASGRDLNLRHTKNETGVTVWEFLDSADNIHAGKSTVRHFTTCWFHFNVTPLFVMRIITFFLLKSCFLDMYFK